MHYFLNNFPPAGLWGPKHVGGALQNNRWLFAIACASGLNTVYISLVYLYIILV
jgi:hypothetical protein